MSPIALALLLTSGPAWGKDLQGRIGVGFQAGLDDRVALAVRYGLPMGRDDLNLLVELHAGVDFQGTVDDGWGVGIRGLYAVVIEDNLNLYAAVGVAWVTTDGTGVVRLQPAAAAEWFAFGVENLGITVQWGLAVDIGSGVAIRTFGGGPGLGLNYYF
jgi:hypothetical protein